MNNKIIKLLITLMIAVTMVACGGGGGGGKGEPTNIDQNPGNNDTQGGQQDDDTQGGQQDDDQQSNKDDDTGPTKKTGTFLGAVAGVGYRSDSHEGVTNIEGEFEYEPGETVTFFIGEVVLGEVHTPADEAADETTQVSVEGSDDETFTTDFTFHNILNMLQFFLALDDDNDSDNGIVITPETAAKTEDLDNPILDFTMSLNDFEDFLNGIVSIFSNSTAVPVEDVQTGLNNLFGQNSQYTGIWTAKFTIGDNNCGFDEGSVDQEYRSFIYDLGNTLPDLMGGSSLFLQIVDDFGVALVDLAVDDNEVSLSRFSFGGREGTFSVDPATLLLSDDDKYMVGEISWRHDAISGLTFCTGFSTMELFSDFSGGTTPDPIQLPTEPTGDGCFGELTLAGDDTDMLGETYMPVQFNGNGSETFFYWQIFDTIDNLQWYLMVTLRGDNLGTNDVIAVDFFGNTLEPVDGGNGFVWSYSTNNNNGCITGDRRRCNVIVDDNHGLVTFKDLVLGGVTGVKMDGSAPPLVIDGTLSKNRADHCTL